MMARQCAEGGDIVGKPPVNKYFRVMHPSDLDRGFDGSFAPFKVI